MKKLQRRAKVTKTVNHQRNKGKKEPRNYGGKIDPFLEGLEEQA